MISGDMVDSGGGGGETGPHSLVWRPNVKVVWRTTNELRVGVLGNG